MLFQAQVLIIRPNRPTIIEVGQNDTYEDVSPRSLVVILYTAHNRYNCKRATITSLDSEKQDAQISKVPTKPVNSVQWANNLARDRSNSQAHKPMVKIIRSQEDVKGV